MFAELKVGVSKKRQDLQQFFGTIEPSDFQRETNKIKDFEIEFRSTAKIAYCYWYFADRNAVGSYGEWEFECKVESKVKAVFSEFSPYQDFDTRNKIKMI